LTLDDLRLAFVCNHPVWVIFKYLMENQHGF
jgi:hypothetical protein